MRETRGGGLTLGRSWERATVLLQVASAIVQKALTGERVLSSICYFLNVYFYMGDRKSVV